MADEKKKPKIDLKARLGKTAVGQQSPSTIPLPMPGPSQSGGLAPPTALDSSPSRPPSVPVPPPSVAPRPMGIAPPPGISPGIPLPPFGQQPQTRRPVEAKPSAQAQTIKVEIGEELEEERARMKKRTMIFAVIAAGVGAMLGFFIGGASKTGELGKRVQDGAAHLEKDVKAANEKLAELDQKLIQGATNLKEKKFPDDLATALGGISIPFDAGYLENKGVGNYPGVLQKKVFSFAQSVTDLNQTKDSLKNLLGFAKAPIEKSWREQSDPVANFSVIFHGDNKGMMADLVPNKDPFSFSKDWPDSFTILKPEKTQQGTKATEKKAARWKKGDLTGNDPVAIPVSADSVAAFTSEQLVFKLQSALRDALQVMEGNKEDPTHETDGLLKDGDALATELHKLSIAK